MNYGLYLSASGVLTNRYRQDVFANNLANVETVGFKPDLPAIHQRDAEAVEDQLGYEVSDRLLDALGGGALAGPQRVRFAAGPLTRTGAPLDVALDDEHSFFAVQHLDPRSGEASVQLTRDGRFSRNAAGELVTQAGHRVLDAQDQPIAIPADTTVSIDRNGRVVTAEGEAVAQIQVARVEDPQRLLKQGQNLFAFRGADPREAVELPVVQPGYVEASGVNPITTLIDMTNASKAAGANASMIKYFDRLMDQAVNTLGKVA